MAIRASMHELGGLLLEKLLNADGGGYRGARLDCGQGHCAEFVDYRRKEIVTGSTWPLSLGGGRRPGEAITEVRWRHKAASTAGTHHRAHLDALLQTRGRM